MRMESGRPPPHGGALQADVSVRAALHRYMGQAPLPFAITRGAKHRLVYANPAFRHLAGLADDAPPGEPMAEAFTGARKDALIEILDNAFRSKVERLDASMGPERAGEASLQCAVWPVVGPNGRPEGLGIELHEVASSDAALDQQRQVAEQMLLGALRERGFTEDAEAASEGRRVLLIEAEGARAEANAANLAKVSFLANMSHDLRTPLNAILGYADLLELQVHGPLTENQEMDVARIKRSARYLTSLINDILNFAKIEAGTLDLRIGTVSVADMFAWLEEILDPQLQERELSFVRGDCSALVRADPEKLRQILLNLITNAIKFTPAGCITIACRNAGAIVLIEVADTGVGIPEDQCERIFEPFIQVNRSLTNVNHEGVGLGLAISRNLARAMGGDLTVRSLKNKGSTFQVTLPAAQEESVRAERERVG
ncbi:MAG: HAMP domain-containing sensor histidine kinase [Gemmatimonadales bacterium]